MENNSLQHHGIKGQKWGIRRYQNEDGTLTKEGQKRYEREKRENAGKKKENRIDTSKPDPKRWVKEDLERSKRVTDSTSNLVKQAQALERETAPKPKKERLDLNNISDQELRQKINRELLERQYSDMFGKDQAAEISKGRQFAREALEATGTVLTIGSTALSIALAIKELKG